MKSVLDIPQDIVNLLAGNNIVLQWISVEVRGMPISTAHHRANLWESCCYGDWQGLLDFLGDGAKQPGTPIVIDGLMLHSRPMHVQKIARQHKKADAADALLPSADKIIGGPDVPGGRHKTALAFNKLHRSVEPIMIPDGE